MCELADERTNPMRVLRSVTRQRALLLSCSFLLSAAVRSQTVYVPVRGVTWPVCETVPDDFVHHVRGVLADSARMFTSDYPVPVPFTCELLGGLREAMKDDSIHYHFEHLAQRYWKTDPQYRSVMSAIDRHLDFHLAIAATGHFFADVRIVGLKKLQEYRRMRPLVCTTKEGSARLEKQDRQAVRYLLHVMENTPMFISGSENSTIHQVYIGEVMRTLDLFTGQDHNVDADTLLRVNMSEASLATALADWRQWLER